MAVLLFVLFWIILAVGLVVIAMTAGRRRSGGSTPGRGGRAHWYALFAATLLLFGIGVPVASSIGNDDNSKKIPQADISKLSAAQIEGRQIFAQYCHWCHTLKAAAANASVGPNLDQLRPTKAVVLDAIKNGRARGNGAMPKDLVVGQEAEDVANFVSAAVGHGGK
jgi:mono/diheme cytochrome c family protein